MNFLDEHNENPPPGAAPPVFIIGCPRSGTTLLRNIIDSHENIACPPESKFISGLIPMMKHPSVLEGLRGMGYSQRELLRLLRRLVETPFREYASRQNKGRWADKTPNYFRIVDFLDEIFEGSALFVFVVRHPLDCAHSCEETFRMVGQRFLNNDPELGAHIERYGCDRYAFVKMWQEVNERLYVFSALNAQRCHLLRYEDLVADPAGTLEPLFAFLGESLPPDIVERTFSTDHGAGIGDYKFQETSRIEAGSVGLYKSWPERERQVLWQLVEGLAASLGYSVG